MNAKQSFILAIKSLLASKMRSFLTMLGIIIGVASVIVLVSLVDGMSKDMVSTFENMGTNLISVSIRGRGGNRSVSAEDMLELVYDNPDVLAAMSPAITRKKWWPLWAMTRKRIWKTPRIPFSVPTAPGSP